MSERKQEAEGLKGLRGVRVVDLSTGIAGAYATKLFADAHADVVKVEPSGGDPLRRRTATGADLGDSDGALFRFLSAGKQSVVGEEGDAVVHSLIAGADLVVESGPPGCADGRALAARHDGLVVLSITGFGQTGPWVDHPWSEFTLQAASGSIGRKGNGHVEPFQSGGRITEWVGGSFAAVAALAAVWRARRAGHGEHIDFSLLEMMNFASGGYLDLAYRLTGEPQKQPLPSSLETPSIEPTADGYVGFCTTSGQQFSDFLLLIERPDLLESEEFSQSKDRQARFSEWCSIVRSWTKRHTTEEILERAALLRLPAAPVLNGETVLQFPPLKARGVFEPSADGDFLQPRRPYRFDDVDPPTPAPSPALGEHTARIDVSEPVRERPRPSGPARLPFEGLRLIDMTAWWAGPSATGVLAALGADVIHVESITRLDGIRNMGGLARHRYSDWWEAGAFFLAANTNKRGLTLDLGAERGRALLHDLVRVSDGLIENFTPRVLENFGLTWEALRETNPRLLLVRMPAFGLSGPWRDRTGFAQTMEQLTGLAWVTGHPDDQPRIQQGPCDPLAGMHGAWAFQVGLFERERTGHGHHIESTMVEAALNAAAEPVVEFSAYGRVLGRTGNRSPTDAPQGLYRCAPDAAGEECRIALTVETDAQWRALRELLGVPEARGPEMESVEGRHEAHDQIDAWIERWTEQQGGAAAVERLRAAGIPAAELADGRFMTDTPQLHARGFFEEIDRAVVGRLPTPTVPFRYASVDRWLRAPAPTVGEHNHEILGDLLGLSDEDVSGLEADGVIGTRPKV